MSPTHSLRWRIQLWHGALLLAVLVGLGIAAYRYQWTNILRRVDGELRERASLVMDSLPRRRPPPPPREFGERPPGGPEGGGPGGAPDRPMLRLTPELTDLFAKEDAGYYYAIWRTDGGQVAHSVSAPSELPRPERPFQGVAGSVDRSRGMFREAFLFTPPGECILAGRSLEPEAAAMRQYARWLMAIGGGVWLLGFCGGWWLTGRALRPLKAITATSGHIAEGRLAERIAVEEPESELGQLATALNSTFARLEAAFAQQAQFTADAAHELRTPVSVVMSQAQLGLRGERSAGEYREMLDACLRAARRMDKLTQSLLELTRHDVGAVQMKREPCDLAVLARESAELLQRTAIERQLALDLELTPAPCSADADRIAQVILNLLSNAFDHTPAEGRIVIHTYRAGEFAVLAIADTGRGIAPEHLPHVFDRFYRVDASRNRRTGGAGLGLAICKAIAEAHGGTLGVESTEGAGCTFTLRLPGA
jgi:heavy metal sensor kinase